MSQVTIREMKVEDRVLLEEFLYLAVHQRDPAVPVPRSVTSEPGVRIYIEAVSYTHLTLPTIYSV